MEKYSSASTTYTVIDGHIMDDVVIASRPKQETHRQWLHRMRKEDAAKFAALPAERQQELIEQEQRLRHARYDSFH